MEKRILFTTTISYSFHKQVISTKKEIIKIDMLKTWSEKAIKEVKEISELNLAEEETIGFIHRPGHMFSKIFETDKYLYKFSVEEVDFIN